MEVCILTGAEFERYDDAGGLIDLTPQEMAEAAFVGHRGEIYAPQREWVRDYAGQVTNGRIGKPAIRYCPISWLPQKVADEVKALLAGAL